MPKARPKYTSTGGGGDYQSTVQPLAVYLVELGYHRAIPKVARNKRYLLVGTDYFTKWVETEPLANIKDVDAKKFV